LGGAVVEGAVTVQEVVDMARNQTPSPVPVLAQVKAIEVLVLASKLRLPQVHSFLEKLVGVRA
jgi:glycerol-3-phosphate dehydrogenase